MGFDILGRPSEIFLFAVHIPTASSTAVLQKSRHSDLKFLYSSLPWLLGKGLQNRVGVQQTPWTAEGGTDEDQQKLMADFCAPCRLRRSEMDFCSPPFCKKPVFFLKHDQYDHLYEYKQAVTKNLSRH